MLEVADPPVGLLEASVRLGLDLGPVLLLAELVAWEGLPSCEPPSGVAGFEGLPGDLNLATALCREAEVGEGDLKHESDCEGLIERYPAFAFLDALDEYVAELQTVLAKASG